MRPNTLKQWSRIIQRNTAGENAGIAAHMCRALNVVLTTQRVNAGACLANVSGKESEIDQAHDSFSTLRVFGHSQTMKTHRRFGTGVESSGFSDQICFDPQSASTFSEKTAMVIELIPLSHAFSRELTVKQLLFNDRASHCIQERDVCAGSWAQVNRGVLRKLDLPGSITTRFAPFKAACLIRAPTIGWFSVAFAPQTRIVRAFSMSL